MFMLHLEDNTPISTMDVEVGNEIYLEVDSTDTDPESWNSEWVKCNLGLPAGYQCIQNPTTLEGGALVKPEGTTSRFWRLTTDDPAIIDNPTEYTQLVLSINAGTPTVFWVRANTEFEEQPKDDRSVALKVTGEIEKVV